MNRQHNWKFKDGDIVMSEKHGAGVVTKRTLQSRWEMARPVKIVEREMYSVMFGKTESIVTVDVDEITPFAEV